MTTALSPFNQSTISRNAPASRIYQRDCFVTSIISDDAYLSVTITGGRSSVSNRICCRILGSAVGAGIIVNGSFSLITHPKVCPNGPKADDSSTTAGCSL